MSVKCFSVDYMHSQYLRFFDCQTDVAVDKVQRRELVNLYECILHYDDDDDDDDCFYIALFSALEQTHCARM